MKVEGCSWQRSVFDGVSLEHSKERLSHAFQSLAFLSRLPITQLAGTLLGGRGRFCPEIYRDNIEKDPAC